MQVSRANVAGRIAVVASATAMAGYWGVVELTSAPADPTETLPAIERAIGPLDPSVDLGPQLVRLGPSPTAVLGESPTTTAAVIGTTTAPPATTVTSAAPATSTTTVASAPTTTAAASVTTPTTEVPSTPTTEPPASSTTTVPVSTTLAPPSSTTTVPTDPESPPSPSGLPPGTWDAALAGSAAGALTSQGPVSGIHVGPGHSHATISSAVASAPAGSTIVVHENGGAYRESFSHDQGWLGKTLRFVAAPGERPVVSGADVVDAWTAAGGRWVHEYTGDRFEFPLPSDDNIIPSQISGSSPNAGLLEQVFVDGVPLRQAASLDGVRSGEFYVDRVADRIYLADDPTGRMVEVTSRARALMLTAGASGSSVEGITITAFSPRHLDGRAMVVLDGATDVTLRDVTMSRSSATGLVAIGADRLVLERVSMVANGARGMSGDRLDDVVIVRSRFENNNVERFDWANCGGGTYCVLAGVKLTRSTGVTVTFSDFSDNQATGFWCDLECRGLVFVANHAAANSRHGVYYEVSEDAVIEANIFASNDGAGVKTSGSRDVSIAHNTFVANGAQLNIGADYRPGTIDFHTASNTHMRNIDVVDNVFAETISRIVVIDPVNHDTAPAPWDRLGSVAGNLYLLIDGDDGSGWRFRMPDGRFELNPSVAADPTAVAFGNPLAHFDDGLSDLRLVGSVAALTSGPLSPAAAGFFPTLEALPPGAPLS